MISPTMEWVCSMKMLSTDMSSVMSKNMKKNKMDTVDIKMSDTIKVQIMPLQIFPLIKYVFFYS